MSTTVSASDTPAQVLVSKNGAPGDKGLPGDNATGLNNIRKNLLDNPLLHIFKTNALTTAIAPTGTDADIAWTRASTATYVDRYGVIQTAAINTPREDAEGFLTEGASTNKCLYSQDFSNAAWGKVGSSITSNNLTSPDGTATGDTLVVTAVGGSNCIQVITATLGVQVTVSGFFKKGTTSYGRVKIASTAFPSEAPAFFDLDSATVVSAINADSASIKRVSNGWLRWQITFTPTATADYTVNLQVSGNGTDTVTGEIGVWGCQSEDLPLASSYIPTTSSAATRSADIVESQVYNNIPSLSGSWSVSCSFNSALSADTLNNTILMFGDSFNQQRIMIKNDGSLVLRDSATSRELLPAGTCTANQVHGLIVTYDGVNSIGYIDGVGGSGVACTLSEVTGSSRWGDRLSVVEYINGHIKDARVYDKVLNADEVAFLNAGG